MPGSLEMTTAELGAPSDRLVTGRVQHKQQCCQQRSVDTRLNIIGVQGSTGVNRGGFAGAAGCGRGYTVLDCLGLVD